MRSLDTPSPSTEGGAPSTEGGAGGCAAPKICDPYSGIATPYVGRRVKLQAAKSMDDVNARRNFRT